MTERVVFAYPTDAGRRGPRPGDLALFIGRRPPDFLAPAGRACYAITDVPPDRSCVVAIARGLYYALDAGAKTVWLLDPLAPGPEDGERASAECGTVRLEPSASEAWRLYAELVALDAGLDL